MIKDYIKENLKYNCNKIFITIDNTDISYKIFDDHIYNIELFICSQKIFPKRIKVNCLNKYNILASIVACNRLNIVPIIFPPKDKMIKFLDYNKIAESDCEIKDNSCIVQYKRVDVRENILYNNNDVQCVLFTSGTGMNPKGVELTFENIYNSTLNWKKIVCFDSNDKYLNVLPLWHISGLSIFFRSIYFNFQSIVSNYKKNNVLSLIQKHNINCISVVPKMIDDLILLQNKDFFLNDFKIIIVGGDAITKSIFNNFKNNNIKAYISYGMTETSSGVSGYFVCDVDEYADGFLGYPHSNTTIDIKRGHIEINSKSVMKKYINSKNCNGKFLTQDLGILKNNKLFYKSRNANFIISGGENINLDIIEKVILGYDENIKIKISGIKDSKWGQVSAVIIDKNKFNIDEIKKHCKKYLPKYMMPKYFFDTSESHKINKKNIV